MRTHALSQAQDLAKNIEELWEAGEEQAEALVAAYADRKFLVSTFSYYTKGDCFGRAAERANGDTVLEAVEGENMGDAPFMYDEQVDYFVILIDGDGTMRSSSAVSFPNSLVLLWADREGELRAIREHLLDQAAVDPEWTQ